MKKFLISLMLIGLTASAYAADKSGEDDSGFCSVGDSNSPCNVKGGFFSEQEVKNVMQHDAAPTDQIYKEMKDGKIYLYLFYAYDCPHCKKAHEFLEELKKQYPELIVLQYEVKKNKNNIKFFESVAGSYGVKPQGVPTIFIGGKNFVGFDEKVTCNAIIKEVRSLKGIKDSCATSEIDVPLLGTINIRTISLPMFTVYIGLLDGLNPCAMWVLMFLLGLMVYAKDRKKIIFLGTTFVVASGVVYFLFMTAWVNIFLVIGYSRFITIALGIVAVTMGLVNVKELFFFKKGISLMIPKSAKPKLYKKSRAIIYEKNKIFAVIGTIMLAVFVNFIELGCTVGLPAIYTRILSLKNLPPLQTYLYIAFYNVLYVVPLAIIVIIFAVTLGHMKFTDRFGKIFKLISGILMLLLGILLILFPGLLIIT
ncbi:MAG: thioredoxin family protein [Proteobacteria bacterium]|nr:thioredoxin family protein [Pseudomonadota bacterium]